MVPLVVGYICFSLIQENRLATIVCETQKSGTRYSNFFLFPLKKKTKKQKNIKSFTEWRWVFLWLPLSPGLYQRWTHFPAWTAQLTCFHESPFAQWIWIRTSSLIVRSSTPEKGGRIFSEFPRFDSDSNRLYLQISHVMQGGNRKIGSSKYWINIAKSTF